MAEPCALVIVVNDREFGAFAQAFEVDTETNTTAGGVPVHWGATVGGCQVALIQCLAAGASSDGGAMETLNPALVDLEPSLVVAGGVCFGLQSPHIEQGAQRLGDVLVAEQARSYEFWRVSGDVARTEDRSRLHWVPVKAGRAIKAAAKRKNAPEHQTGLFMTGDKLCDDLLGLRTWLKTNYPEAIGADMEGVSIATVCDRCKIDWVVVKGISDWGEGDKKGVGDDQQLVSAANAAAFTRLLLETGLFGGRPEPSPLVVPLALGVVSAARFSERAPMVLRLTNDSDRPVRDIRLVAKWAEGGPAARFKDQCPKQCGGHGGAPSAVTLETLGAGQSVFSCFAQPENQGAVELRFVKDGKTHSVQFRVDSEGGRPILTVLA